MKVVVVVRAGVGGLGTALALGRAGHDVTVLERDNSPMPADPEKAFASFRRGVPQARQSHSMLARLRILLRERPAGGKRLVQRARGYVATIKRGVVVRSDDEPTGERPGCLLRGSHKEPS